MTATIPKKAGRREDAQRPAEIKTPQRRSAFFDRFFQQPGSDQKTAEYKKQMNAKA